MKFRQCRSEFLLLAAGASLCLLFTSCWPSSKTVQIGPDARASLVIYYKTGVSDAEIEKFLQEVLSTPDPEGRGYYMREGIGLRLRVSSVQGHEGTAVNFTANSSLAQREKIKASILSSPIVYKLLENIAPTEVKALN